MKTFRYKHTALIWALLSVVLALSIGAIIWNTFSLVKDTELSTNNTLSYLFIIVSGALLSAFTISVMLGSKYVIKNGVLVLLRRTYATDEIMEKLRRCRVRFFVVDMENMAE